MGEGKVNQWGWRAHQCGRGEFIGGGGGFISRGGESSSVGERRVHQWGWRIHQWGGESSSVGWRVHQWGRGEFITVGGERSSVGERRVHQWGRGGFSGRGGGFISGGEESSSMAERRVRRCGRGGFISGERSVWVKSSSLEDRSVTTEGVEVGSEGFDHQCR